MYSDAFGACFLCYCRTYHRTELFSVRINSSYRVDPDVLSARFLCYYRTYRRTELFSVGDSVCPLSDREDAYTGYVGAAVLCDSG